MVKEGKIAGRGVLLAGQVRRRVWVAVGRSACVLCQSLVGMVR